MKPQYSFLGPHRCPCKLSNLEGVILHAAGQVIDKLNLKIRGCSEFLVCLKRVHCHVRGESVSKMLSYN